MTTDTIQLTIDGEPNGDDSARERPRTMQWCDTCDEWLLRSARHDHPHRLYETPEEAEAERREGHDDPDPDPPEDDDEDEPEKIGGRYSIRLHYSMEYHFYVNAWDERDAIERAKEMVDYGNANDAHSLHTDSDEVRAIMSDEADKYGLDY